MANRVTKQIYLVIVASMGWFALAGQLYLILAERTTSVAETLVRYFSFFTILINITVAACATAALFKGSTRLGAFLSKPRTLTAATVYIAVVGLVYNIILRRLWKPVGLQNVVNELLHSVIPLLFILFWMLWVDKRDLKWKYIPGWLIFPAVYAVYILIRGAFSGLYPYPFMNVNVLGYAKVFINSGLLVLVFLLFSILPIAIGKIVNRMAANN